MAPPGSRYTTTDSTTERPVGTSAGIETTAGTSRTCSRRSMATSAPTRGMPTATPTTCRRNRRRGGTFGRRLAMVRRDSSRVRWRTPLDSTATIAHTSCFCAERTGAGGRVLGPRGPRRGVDRIHHLRRLSRRECRIRTGRDEEKRRGPSSTSRPGSASGIPPVRTSTISDASSRRNTGYRWSSAPIRSRRSTSSPTPGATPGPARSGRRFSPRRWPMKPRGWRTTRARRSRPASDGGKRGLIYQE